MLALQAMYQTKYADNPVSYTANVPEGLDADETMDVIKRWLPDMKGHHDHGRGHPRAGPYERITAEQFTTYGDLDRGLHRRGLRDRGPPCALIKAQTPPAASRRGAYRLRPCSRCRAPPG